jgi:hypothetical protein
LAPLNRKAKRSLRKLPLKVIDSKISIFHHEQCYVPSSKERFPSISITKKMIQLAARKLGYR